MNILKASEADFDIVKNIVHATIKLIYPKYYPEGVVNFFLSHHSNENILKGIQSEKVFLLDVDGTFVGTGSIKENEICRLFILPQYQGLGYGTSLMNELENIIAIEHSEILLDSSLPAYNLYIKRGYVPIKYEKITAPNTDVLCFNVMKKFIVRNIDVKINYNNLL